MKRCARRSHSRPRRLRAADVEDSDDEVDVCAPWMLCTLDQPQRDSVDFPALHPCPAPAVVSARIGFQPPSYALALSFLGSEYLRALREWPRQVMINRAQGIPAPRACRSSSPVGSGERARQ